MNLTEHGTQLFPRVLNPADCAQLAERLGFTNSRISNDPSTNDLCAPAGALGAIAAALLGPEARPVKAILFNKSAEQNWRVGWHQDRTIAVRQRIDTPGFERWTTKAGITHVEPPFEVIDQMISLRLHLDHCGKDSGPLRIVVSSHLHGKVTKPDAAALAKENEVLTCEAHAGDVWAYATGIVHASDRAVVPSNRRILQIDFASKDLPGQLEWLGLTNAPRTDEP